MIWLYVYGALCSSVLLELASRHGKDDWPHGICVTLVTVLLTASLFQLLIYCSFNICKIVYLTITGGAA